MSNVKYYDNGNGTVIKTLIDKNGVEETYAYDILVGKNIPKSDSIVDYCYSQFEENLMEQLKKKIPNPNEFCSGTCAAMALAITYGDKTITPLSVLLWGGDEAHPETCTANWGSNGLQKWEQEDYDTEDAQMYDNRVGGKYQAVDDSFMENNDEYLKNLKIYLSEGLPVIIRVNNHFMVVVGVESDVKLEDATLDQLVVFDPGWKAGENDEDKIVTFKQSGRYKENNRMVTPYPIDSGKKFVYDEHKKKTRDPYYVDPVTKADGSIIPAYAGRPLKEAIATVNNSLMSQEDKEEKVKGLMKLFTEESDIQSGGSIIERIVSLPYIYSGNIGSGTGGYYYRLHYGKVGNGAPMRVNYYSANSSGGDTVYYPCHYAEPMVFWFVLYKNGTNRVVGAAAVNKQISHQDNFFSEQYEYSTRWKDTVFKNEQQSYTEYEHWLYSFTKRNISGAELSVKKQNYNELVFNFTIKYEDEITYYKAYEEDSEKYVPAPALTVKNKEVRTGSFQIYDSFYLPFLYTSSAFYSDLSAENFAREMVRLTTVFNEI